jgi:hypothetical protein
MPYFLATSSDAGASAGALVLLFLLFLFGCVVWIMPGVIASLRKHRNQGAIWALTILGGWTFIGWIMRSSGRLPVPHRLNRSLSTTSGKTEIDDQTHEESCSRSRNGRYAEE